jgi:hypothetical protein
MKNVIQKKRKEETIVIRDTEDIPHLESAGYTYETKKITTTMSSGNEKMIEIKRH